MLHVFHEEQGQVQEQDDCQQADESPAELFAVCRSVEFAFDVVQHDSFPPFFRFM